MGRTRGGKQWIDRHLKDPYVREARARGMRSRAGIKLEQLDRRQHLLKAGMTVIDLGAAPGGWSELAIKVVGGKGRVIALDRIEMPPIEGVEFIQGDFTEQETYDHLRQIIGNDPVGLVMSDMAPNISGISSVDQPRTMHLAELASELACEVLRPGGGLLVKAFQGEGIDAWLRTIRQRFPKVVICKPDASRSRSREVYVLARNYRVV